MDALWLSVFAVSVFVVVMLIALELLKSFNKTDWQKNLLAFQSIRKINLSNSLQNWVLRAEKELNGPKILRRDPGFLLFITILAIAGFVFGLSWLKNPVGAIVLAVAGVVLPEQIMFNRERTYREKIIEQLGAAVRIFAAEYSDTPHPVSALGKAARRLPDPIGGILRNTEKDLILGKDRDAVLINLAKELDSEYGRMFVQLLRLSFEDEAVKPLFSRLAARISSQQNLLRKNRIETAADRIMAVILNTSVIPVYFLMRKMVPETHEFFTMTATGRLVIVLCLLSVIIGATLDRLMNRGEVVG
jgi:Flp pilus assembly protein TadB